MLLGETYPFANDVLACGGGEVGLAMLLVEVVEPMLIVLILVMVTVVGVGLLLGTVTGALVGAFLGPEADGICPVCSREDLLPGTKVVLRVVCLGGDLPVLLAG